MVRSSFSTVTIFNRNGIVPALKKADDGCFKGKEMLEYKDFPSDKVSNY
ncbi:MAG: hypothetical protein ACFBSE_01485 [Prochloraceae cyanobacterium]